MKKCKIPLWDFSLRLYNQKVEKALLEIQSRFDTNINLIFFALYLAYILKQPLQKNFLMQAEKKIESFHQITLSYRSLRQKLSKKSSLYSYFFSKELSFEKKQQNALEQIIPPSKKSLESKHALARENLFLVLPKKNQLINTLLSLIKHELL